MGRVLDYMLELVKAPGVSGYEGPVREAVLGLLPGELRERARVDAVGNLVVEAGGEGPRVVLMAHMDEVGLVVNRVTGEGLIGFRKVGGIVDYTLPGTRVTIHTSKGPVEGVIGAEPPHLRLERGERQEPPAWHKLYIDVGASSREEVLELGVSILDPVTLDKTVTRLAGGRAVAARSIDDRVGCAALVEVARRIASGEAKPRARVTLAWTVQEEIGLYGARALAARLNPPPDLAIAVDTVTCCRPEVTGEMRWDAGPVVRAIDNYAIAHIGIARRILEKARRAGVPAQPATAGGGTDAAAFIMHGVPAVALTAPVKYTHSTVETIHSKTPEQLADLITLVIEYPPIQA